MLRPSSRGDGQKFSEKGAFATGDQGGGFLLVYHFSPYRSYSYGSYKLAGERIIGVPRGLGVPRPYNKRQAMSAATFGSPRPRMASDTMVPMHGTWGQHGEQEARVTRQGTSTNGNADMNADRKMYVLPYYAMSRKQSSVCHCRQRASCARSSQTLGIYHPVPHMCRGHEA